MSEIQKELCVGCGKCVHYCPVGALAMIDGKAQVDLDECVECKVCIDADICPKNAIFMPELIWPRTIRQDLSNPRCVCKTGVPGRGTEEMKTNDVTHRFKEGEVGLCAELGRPGVGARIRDIEKVAMALAKVTGVEFEPCNPITSLMVDLKTGKMNDDTLDEKVLSGIVEVKLPLESTENALAALREVESFVDTVFSVDLVTVVYADGSQPPVDIARQMGIEVYPNCKTNLGMGQID